jgi:hypothetical protein
LHNRVRKLIPLVVLLAIFLPRPASAQGGPPLLTDDPDTPGPGYWEINLSTFLERQSQGTTIEMPRLDANYGVGRRIQLKFEVPWLRESEDGSIRTGAGNAVTGVKYRFVGQEGKTIAWSVYPQLEFNTMHASVTEGLVEDGRQLLLPTELTLEVLHVEINGEAGRRFAEAGGSGWIYGLSTEGHVAPRLELLAEVHGERPKDGSTEWIVNFGARPKLTRQMILMLAVGRGLSGPADERPRLLFYTGLQVNVPGLYSFK